jgi:hypothetical protein
MKTLLFVLIILCSCTNKKAEIVDEIRAQQNLFDSLKKEYEKEIFKYQDLQDSILSHFDINHDTLPLRDEAKSIHLQKLMGIAQKNIDSLILELKKY